MNLQLIIPYVTNQLIICWRSVSIMTLTMALINCASITPLHLCVTLRPLLNSFSVCLHNQWTISLVSSPFTRELLLNCRHNKLSLPPLFLIRFPDKNRPENRTKKTIVFSEEESRTLRSDLSRSLLSSTSNWGTNWFCVNNHRTM